MKQFLRKFTDRLEKAVLDVACLHQIGMTQKERDNFIGIVDPHHDEAHFLVKVAELKSDDTVASAKGIQYQ